MPDRSWSGFGLQDIFKSLRFRVLEGFFLLLLFKTGGGPGPLDDRITKSHQK